VGLAAFGFGSPTPRPEGIGRRGQQNHSDEPAEECDTRCSRVGARQIRIIKRAQNQFLRLLAIIQSRAMSGSIRVAGRSKERRQQNFH
jgi:hypothetical protein